MRKWILTRKPFARKKPVEMPDKPLPNEVQLWSRFSKRHEQEKRNTHRTEQIPVTDQATFAPR